MNAGANASAGVWLMARSRLPASEIAAPPEQRGNAPIGKDGHPIELHHKGQAADSKLVEMSRTQHRGKGNFKKNHPNTGQKPSKIDRTVWKKQRTDYWKGEWDRGRFAKPKPKPKKK